MKYKTMKVLCMFDLPMNDGRERRAYRQFRKKLIADGFVMMQLSIYVKTCPSRENCETVVRRLKCIAPNAGNVRLLIVTEVQYESMIFIVGTESIEERVAKKRGLIVL